MLTDAQKSSLEKWMAAVHEFVTLAMEALQLRSAADSLAVANDAIQSMKDSSKELEKLAEWSRFREVEEQARKMLEETRADGRVSRDVAARFVRMAQARTSELSDLVLK